MKLGPGCTFVFAMESFIDLMLLLLLVRFFVMKVTGVRFYVSPLRKVWFCGKEFCTQMPASIACSLSFYFNFCVAYFFAASSRFLGGLLSKMRDWSNYPENCSSAVKFFIGRLANI